MNSYNRYMTLLWLLLFFSLSACSSITGNNVYESPGQDYFYGEFSDIPIPREMNKNTETTIITTPHNIKTGLQSFRGRVEAGSLIRAMQSYLAREGWILQAATRGATSLQIFDKPDRYCVIYVEDGSIFTEMQVYVAPKLNNEAASASVSATPLKE